MFTGVTVRVRGYRPGRRVVDATVGVAAALVTAGGTWDRIVPWLPHIVIVPIALGQGFLLLARRRAPMAVLGAATLLGVLVRVAGFPAGGASFAMCCAAYAVAGYGRRTEGAELAGILRGAAAVLVAAGALAVAGVASPVRDPSGFWSSFTPGVLIAASWMLGYALRTRRD